MTATYSSPLYNDIWDILKSKGKCKVAAHPALHSRIIHAVVNKKYYDTGYKFELSEKLEHAILYYTKGKNHIEFRLAFFPDLRSMKHISIGDI